MRTCGAKSFFKARFTLGAALLGHQRHVLLRQMLKPGVVGGVRRRRLGLLAGHVASDRFAVLAALQVIVRAVGTLAQNAEFAGLHAFDLSDLLQQQLRAWIFVHRQNIYIRIYFANKNPLAAFINPEFCLSPSRMILPLSLILP